MKLPLFLFLSFVFYCTQAKLFYGESKRFYEIPFKLKRNLKYAKKDHNKIVACKLNADAPSKHVDKPEHEFRLKHLSVPFREGLCTHLIYSFCEISTNYNYTSLPCSDKKLEELSRFVSKFEDLKVLIEVQISHALISELSENTNAKLQFIRNTKDWIWRFGFHGLSIENGASFFKQQSNYWFTIFAKELKDEFSQLDLQIGIQIPLVSSTEIRNYKTIAEISRIFDFVWLGAFNYHKTTTNTKTTGHNAPLYPYTNFTENIFENLKLLLVEKGVEPKSLILSVPLFAIPHQIYIFNELAHGFNSTTNGLGYNGTIYKEKFKWGFNEVCLSIESTKIKNPEPEFKSYSPKFESHDANVQISNKTFKSHNSDLERPNKTFKSHNSDLERPNQKLQDPHPKHKGHHSKLKSSHQKLKNQRLISQRKLKRSHPKFRRSLRKFQKPNSGPYIMTSNTWPIYWDTEAQVPFMMKKIPGDFPYLWLSFESPWSIREKTELAVELGLGGILAETIDTDDFVGECFPNVTFPILRTIHDAIWVVKRHSRSAYCSLVNESAEKKHKPIVRVEFLSTRNIVDGSKLSENSFQVNCLAYGNPEPKINWYQRINGTDHSITTAKMLNVKHENDSCAMKAVSMQLSVVKEQKVEGYYCLAKNSEGGARSLTFDQFPIIKGIALNGSMWMGKTKNLTLHDKIHNFTSTLKKAKRVVVCKISLSASKRKGEAKYDMTDNKTLTAFDGSLCTHVVFSVFHITKDFKIHMNNETLGEMEMLQSIMAKFPRSLKTFVEITISNFNSDLEKKTFIENLSRSSINKMLFRNYMITFLRNYPFGGLSLSSTFYEHTGRNEYDFLVLLKEMKIAFEEADLLLATEIDIQNKEVMANTFGSVVQLSRILDFVFLKGFNFVRTEDGIAGHLAPLFSLQKDDENINDNLNYLIYKMGADPKRLVLAIPFFGYSHTLLNELSPLFGFNSSTNSAGFPGSFTSDKNIWTYNEICLQDWDRYWDYKAKVPFIKNGSKWISFENPQSVYEKVKLVKAYGLRGIMAQSIENDDFRGKCSRKKVRYPLLKTISYALQETEDEMNETIKCPESKLASLLPILSVSSYVFHVNTSRRVKVKCTADGIPKPEITWHHVVDGKAQRIQGINPQSKLENNEVCPPYQRTIDILEIKNFTANNEGKYFCKGTNSKEDSKETIFFLTFKNYPLKVFNDDVWIQKKDRDFTIKPPLDATSPVYGHIQKPTFCMYDSKIKPIEQNINQSLLNLNKILEDRLCTHLVYNNFDIKGHSYETLNTEDVDQLKQLANISSTSPKFKIILGITIENNKQKSGFIKQLTTSKNNIKRFNRNMKILITNLNIHGLYLDSSFSAEVDTPVFEKFSKRLKQELKNLLLITQVDHISRDIEKKCIFSEDNDFLVKISPNVDYIFVNGYNFRQTAQELATHNAPLKSFRNSDENVFRYLKSLVNENEFPNYKIVLVVPFFGTPHVLLDEYDHLYGLKGRTNISADVVFERGPIFNSSTTWGYNEICLPKKGREGWSWKYYWDYVASVPFAKRGDNWMSFENPRSVYEKANLTRYFNLGGIALNSINFDDSDGKCKGGDYPLLRAIKAAFVVSKSPDNLALATNSWGWIIAVVILFILLGVAIIFSIVSQRKIKGLTRKEIQDFKKGMTEANVYADKSDDPNSRPYDISYEIKDNYTIDQEKVLGSGAFGVVYSGNVNGKPVAVKCVKPDAEKQYLKSLLSEIKILIYLGNHPNIMNLIGASTAELKKGIVYLFVELCPLGSLQDYLRNSVLNVEKECSDDYRKTKLARETITDDVDKKQVTFWNLVNWTYQIANGLQHLSSKKLIHADLAARNVLLLEKDVVKLTDFGLSRKLYDYDNYVKKNQEPLPWRWMALESLRHLTFSIQSDIWSLGITAWEVFSLGETPYPGLSWTVDFVDELTNNMRVQKPKYATDEIYEFLQTCWMGNPNDRPKPEEVTAYFAALAEEVKNA